nr:asparaginase domain-containing protein [Sphingomonas mucosissima]
MARVLATRRSGVVADVLILTTGGTIDKLYFDALSTYQIGESVVDRVLRTAQVTLPYRVAEVMRKDSLELTDEDRAVIARTAAEAPEQRIIITHGTDTMAHTAQALAPAVPGKTIVLVGALSPARFAESDAAFNLGMAIATAQVAAPGVWIAMNGTIFDGLRVRKDRAANAFVAVDGQGRAVAGWGTAGRVFRPAAGD